MKAPQHKPSVDELVSDLGCIPDDKHPGMVGVVIKNRVLWVSVQGSILMDELISSAVIKADGRRRGDIPTAPIKAYTPLTINNIFGEVPPMKFLPEEEVTLGDSGQPANALEVDMGPAEEKVILGEEESETLHLPHWMSSAKGLADPDRHKPVKEEGVE